MIRDKILLYQNYEELNLKCFSCNDKHMVRKCPAIRYVPNKVRIVMIHQNRIKRNKTYRGKLLNPRKNMKYGSLINLKQIQSKAKVVQISDNTATSAENEDSGGELLPIVEISGNDTVQSNKILDIKSNEDNFFNNENIPKKQASPKIPILMRSGTIAMAQTKPIELTRSKSKNKEDEVVSG
jgi:uncharacterized UBP type Zn finger protein